MRRSRLSQSLYLTKILEGLLNTALFQTSASFKPVPHNVWASYKVSQLHQKPCYSANSEALPRPYCQHLWG